VFAQSGPIFWAIRQHREMTGLLNPIVPIASTVKFALRSGADRQLVVKPLGNDARVATKAGRKPRVMIVMVGETARADNFSLGGYGRPTNPELQAKDITYFRDTSSCGTITAVSVPCMFSVYPRSEYTHEKAIRIENLTDVLGHAGIDVAWWDNDLGSKSVADRLKGYRQYYTADDPEFCTGGECLDAILLRDLGGWLDNVSRDSVLVLHIEGSHGPSYHDRYPEAFRRFTPDCRTAEFSECTHEEIVNAYDNTIAYTDHIVASAISSLEQRDGTIEPSLIFVSDHGESLGEYGLYLHGAPYFMAPSQQTHVPYLVWLGQSATSGIDGDCLAAAADEPQSHDNLFHTVLGMMGVSTKVYDSALDSLERCRNVEGAASGSLAYSSESDPGAGPAR
jgi:lipid A ethanolaminephosphotransferase